MTSEESGDLHVIDTFGDSHWEAFKEKRRKHNDNICDQTNKLVLRLDRLINPEEGQKVDLDKSIVEWTPNDLVKMCPYCAKSFTIARRRHHCRVCGAILCDSCSKFLSFKAACKLVQPSRLYVDQYDRIEDRIDSKKAEDMPNIRTCEDCHLLLDKRVQTIDDHYSQPTFLEIYARLRELMTEANALIESQKTLPNPQDSATLELKSMIQDLRQNIAMISSKVKKMAEKEPSVKQAHLLSAINQSIACWFSQSLIKKRL